MSSSRRRKYILDGKEVTQSTWYRKVAKSKKKYGDYCDDEEQDSNSRKNEPNCSSRENDENEPRSSGRENDENELNCSSCENYENNIVVSDMFYKSDCSNHENIENDVTISDEEDLPSDDENSYSSSNDEKDLSTSDEYSSESENELCEEEVTNTNSFQNRLRKWGIKHRIRREAGNELLQELRNTDDPEELKSLPKDFRTVLGNKSNAEKRDDSYNYLGIANILNTSVEKLFNDDCTTLKLTINVDGLPISKSSSKSVWPILGSINSSENVFLIALFCGDSKPSDANNYLEPFVEEVTKLCENGIIIRGKHYDFEFEKVIADAPAKSFLLNSKGSTGYNSCIKCRVIGEWAHNRVFFTNAEPASLRTNADFDDQENDDDDDFCQKKSILFDIPNFDIHCIPYDYMHSECLGIMKKMIEIWTSKVKPLKRILPKSFIEALNDRLYILRNFCPAEFVRKPRFISEFNRWKATEFRQFLFYTGPILLIGLLPTEYLNHFQLLSYVNRMMGSSCGISEEEKNYIESLLSNYIKEFSRLYDESLINHNVHSLTHLAADALMYGALDNFSAFKFENFMSILKNMIRCGKLPMQQIINRYYERISIASTENERSLFILSRPCKNNDSEDIQEFKQLKTRQFLFRSERIADQFCVLNNEDCVLIDRIFQNKTSGQIYIEGSKFEKKKSAYRIPWYSNTVGVQKVSKLSKEKFRYHVEEIAAKCYAIPIFSNTKDVSTRCYTVSDLLKKGNFYVTKLLHHN